ncbi:hypothetical protein TruAng_003890 [Truncatella angustata]|nr:hypothetical protein TruAng_003890 [Truncatella angustata]
MAAQIRGDDLTRRILDRRVIVNGVHQVGLVELRELIAVSADSCSTSGDEPDPKTRQPARLYSPPDSTARPTLQPARLYSANSLVFFRPESASVLLKKDLVKNRRVCLE